MDAWEQDIHAETPDKLVQLAILHAEFEALHPFLDGNGRLGRMFVPLFLWQAGLIRAPVFYISAWLEARRPAYYERLNAVSRDDDWTGWCQFFLEAVMQQAEDNLDKARGILVLYNTLKRRIPELTRSRYAIHVLDWIFKQPLFRSSTFAAHPTIQSPRAARRLLTALCDAGILETIVGGHGSRPAILAFPELLVIVDGDDR